MQSPLAGSLDFPDDLDFIVTMEAVPSEPAFLSSSRAMREAAVFPVGWANPLTSRPVGLMEQGWQNGAGLGFVTASGRWTGLSTPTAQPEDSSSTLGRARQLLGDRPRDYMQRAVDFYLSRRTAAELLADRMHERHDAIVYPADWLPDHDISESDIVGVMRREVALVESPTACETSRGIAWGAVLSFVEDDLGLCTEEAGLTTGEDVLEELNWAMGIPAVMAGSLESPIAYMRSALLRRRKNTRAGIGRHSRYEVSFDVPELATLSQEPAGERRFADDVMVRLDLESCLQVPGVEADHIRLAALRLTGLRDSEIASRLGWSSETLARVRRGLCSDRAPGEALRRHLEAYLKKKFDSSSTNAVLAFSGK